MKAAARLVAVLGAVLVAWLLFRAAPRDVELVYDLSHVPGATGLTVRITRGGEWVRSGDFQLGPGGAQVRQHVKLQDGAYALEYGVATPAGPVRGQRPLEISESGLIVLPLGP